MTISLESIVSGDYKISKFTTNLAASTSQAQDSTTFIVPAGVNSIQYLIVAGGGSGGYPSGGSGYSGGGGGGGGVLQGTLAVTQGQSLTIKIGAGGLNRNDSNVYGYNGGNSQFSSLIAIGGGSGGQCTGNSSYYYTINGVPGGSGGGSGDIGSGNYTGGNGTSGQGYAGGNSLSSKNGSGGGGAGGPGVQGLRNWPTQSYGGPGGIGIQSNISGQLKYYGSGGGGGGFIQSGQSNPYPQNGGAECGGHGARTGDVNSASTSGLNGYGGGGGGGAGLINQTVQYGSPGGSGTVILKYMSKFAFVMVES